MNVSNANLNKMKFSKILNALMEKNKLNAKMLSQSTGIPRTTISEWLGDRMPKLGKDIVNLAKYFNVSLDYLLTGDDKAAITSNTPSELLNGIMCTLQKGSGCFEGEYKVKIEKVNVSKKQD